MLACTGQFSAAADRVVFCRLTPLQVSVYKAVLSHPDMEYVLRIDEECVCGSGLTRGKCCFKVSVLWRDPLSP